MREYSDVFLKEIPGVAPILKAPCRIVPVEIKELKIQLDEILEKGYIKTSILPCGVLVLFMKKKDGSLWLGIDYKELNKITIKNGYLLYQVNDLYD